MPQLGFIIDGIMYKLFIVIIIFLSCSNSENNSEEYNSHHGFSIYLLRDTLLSFNDVKSINIDELELQKDPWITSNDIARYDYSAHLIYLKRDKQNYFNRFKRIRRDKEYFHLNGQPFVVVAFGERIYTGAFKSMFSSQLFRAPTISDMNVLFYPSDVISIGSNEVECDSIFDSRIKEALINSNLYHAGLRLELVNIEVIESADTSTIQYSYTIYNDDEDDLYVLDPDLVTSEIFNHYTNGVYCLNISGSTHTRINSSYKITDNSDWDNSWFTKIPSKGSMSRTVILRGYPKMTTLKYECKFCFSNPNKIEKQDRYINGTRIWLGTLSSNTMQIEIK